MDTGIVVFTSLTLLAGAFALSVLLHYQKRKRVWKSMKQTNNVSEESDLDLDLLFSGELPNGGARVVKEKEAHNFDDGADVLESDWKYSTNESMSAQLLEKQEAGVVAESYMKAIMDAKVRPEAVPINEKSAYSKTGVFFQEQKNIVDTDNKHIDNIHMDNQHPSNAPSANQYHEDTDDYSGRGANQSVSNEMLLEESFKRESMERMRFLEPANEELVSFQEKPHSELRGEERQTDGHGKTIDRPKKENVTPLPIGVTKVESTFGISASEVDDDDVIFVRVIAGKYVMLGKHILALVKEFGLKYDPNKGTFNKCTVGKVSNRIAFSLFNAYSPGRFYIEDMESLRIHGVSFYMILSQDKTPKMLLDTFDEMTAAAIRLSKLCNGKVQNDSMSAMTPQTIEHYRHRIREFSRKSMSTSKVSS